MLDALIENAFVLTVSTLIQSANVADLVGHVIVENKMTIHEARVKGRKLLLQLRRLKRTYTNQLFHHDKALKDLQRHCPHDLVRDEERIQHCAICGKEFE